MSLAMSAECLWARLTVSFASCTASSIFLPAASPPLLMPQKIPRSNCKSSLVLHSARSARSSPAFASIVVMCRSVNSNSLAMQSSLRPRQTQRTTTWSSVWPPITSFCLRNPRNLSCFPKDSTDRPFSFRLLANAPWSIMVRTCVRGSQEFCVCSQREARVAMRSAEGKFLGRLRGGGGSLEKL